MKSFTMTLVDGTSAVLNQQNEAGLAEHLACPKAQVLEMIRQINTAHYYDGLLPEGKESVFVDLGANLGLVSIWASPKCRRVVAVEPELHTYEMLRRLTEPFRTVIEVHQVAIAGETGLVALSVDRADYSCHTVTNPKPGNPVVWMTGMKLLDFFVEQQLEGVTVCKVDIEGAEMEALTSDSLRLAPVQVWYIECHKTPKLTRDQSMAEMTKRLQAAGFRPRTVRPNAIVARR